MPWFHLISWYGNFAERHIFRIVSGDLPETLRKLCLSAKFPHQEISWNYGNLRSGCLRTSCSSVSNSEPWGTLCWKWVGAVFSSFISPLMEEVGKDDSYLDGATSFMSILWGRQGKWTRLTGQNFSINPKRNLRNLSLLYFFYVFLFSFTYRIQRPKLSELNFLLFTY